MTQPDTPARVVIDERTGTIVIGRDVQISAVAVSHGNLTVRVTEMPKVSQPAPLSNGKTVVTPETQITADQNGGTVGDRERRQSRRARRRLEQDRAEAARHHCDSPGHQVGRRTAGRPGGAMMQPVFAHEWNVQGLPAHRDCGLAIGWCGRRRRTDQGLAADHHFVCHRNRMSHHLHPRKRRSREASGPADHGGPFSGT